MLNESIDLLINLPPLKQIIGQWLTTWTNEWMNEPIVHSVIQSVWSINQ